VELRDKLEQIDTLTFGEETEKFIDFVKTPDDKTFFTFLLNRESIGKCFRSNLCSDEPHKPNWSAEVVFDTDRLGLLAQRSSQQ
jgi:hypothetical protein